MKKTVKAIALSLLLGCLISGCNVTPENPTTASNAAPETTTIAPTSAAAEADPPAQMNIQYLPETVEAPEGIPVLKWVCLTEMMLGGGMRVWNEEAAVELNQMLAQRDLPFRVQFVLLTCDQPYGEWEWMEQEGIPELLAGSDLIYGYFSSDEMQKYLLPITEYAEGNAMPSLKNAVPHDIYWGRGRVAGEIYGIAATTTPSPRANGWLVEQAVLADLGLKESDFEGKYLWEMDSLFGEVYQKNGGAPFLSVDADEVVPVQGGVTAYLPGALQFVLDSRYQCIGSCFAIDYSGGVPTVVNYLETDYVRSCQAAIIRYKKLGYTTYRYEDSKVFCTTVGADFPYLTPDHYVAIPGEALHIAAGFGNGFVSGISASTPYPEEALTLLALIAEDKELAMQLFYGKEGRDYLLEDGYYVSVKQEDGSRYNLDFLSCLSYFSGLSCESGSMDFVRAPGVGNGEEPVAEGKTLLQTHRELLDESAVWYPLQHTYSESALREGVLCFDFSGYSREITDMAAILDRYFRFLTNPNQIEDDPDTPEDEFLPEMTEEVYQQMLQELKDAGSDRVLAELQRQLSQWQAARTEKEEGV